MKFLSKRRDLYVPVIIAIAIITGIFIGRYYKNNTDTVKFNIYPRTDKLSNIIQHIVQDYVDPVNKEALIEEVIPKIINELDPHSQYIPASELQKMNEPLDGNFSGIGIQFNMLNDTLIIIQTIANGPSEKVGIWAGDRIVMIDNDTVTGKNLPSDSLVSRLKGIKGTKVKVGIVRKNIAEILYFEIIRDNIPLYSIDTRFMITPDIGYIKINKFSRTTFNEFIDAVRELRSQGMKKIIIDLRNNGGGFMDIAVKIADQFLDNNDLIVYTQGNARKREEYRATQGGYCIDLDVAVLIDEGSASASEILAGAIQDNDRGLIIGRRSFGKGLVQEQNEFNDGSALRLTIARYYTPTGRSIQKPYINGTLDYYEDLNQRYFNGELTEKDSIHFEDSLKYLTPKGKIVYGGGGIMPDIFVPYDTSGITNYLAAVRNMGLIYKFSLNYADDHREKLNRINNIPELMKYLNDHNVFEEFIRFATKNGIKRVNIEISISEKILKTQLYAYIARNILGDEVFYRMIISIDNTLEKAIDELK